MCKWIHIKTSRYSTLFKCIFEEYNKNVVIFIDSGQYTDKDLPKLINQWCVNRIIKRTLNFKLIKDGVELFFFHDTPNDLVAAMSERPFVEDLAKEEIIRYRVYPKEYISFMRDIRYEKRRSLSKSIFKFLKRLFTPKSKNPKN